MHENYLFMHIKSSVHAWAHLKNLRNFLLHMARQSFGAAIREAREHAGLTQAELAERIGTSASTISNLEREQHPPTVPDQVNALAAALPLSTETLLRAMGVTLTSPAAARLPKRLIDALLQLDQETLAGLTLLAERAARGTP